MKKNKTKELTSKIKPHVKGVASIIVACGVGELMGVVMKDFKPDAKGIRKAFVKLGALALTGMVIKAATDYVEGEIDDIFNAVDEFAEGEEGDDEIVDETEA